MGLRIWRGADLLNYERVVAKPSGEPDAQTAYASPSGSCGEAKVISPNL